MRYPLWSASCDSACSVGRLTQIFEGVSQKTQPHDPHNYTLWWSSVHQSTAHIHRAQSWDTLHLCGVLGGVSFPNPPFGGVRLISLTQIYYKTLSAHRWAQQGGGVDFKYSAVAQAAHINVVVPIRGGGVLCADDVAPKSRPHSCAH